MAGEKGKPGRKSSIKDVAELAGVSVSTVSYAISGRRPISAGKKQCIAEAMQKLHYQPNAIARSLASKRTHIIALLFPPVEHGIGISETELIIQAARSATAQGYHLVIWTLQTDEEAELLQLIQQELVDGVILMEVHSADRRIGVLKRFGIPFILMGRDAEIPAEPFIDIDFFATMMQCISYLKGLGHRHLAFINQSKKSYSSGYGPVVRVHEAFTYLCRNFDMDGTELFCDSNPIQTCAVTEAFLADHADTSAFIVMNDKALPGLIRGVEKQGLRIPEDVSIVSIVSSEGTAALFLPQLTTFEMDIHTLMNAVITQLTAKLDGRYAELTRRLFPCILRERQSTAALNHE